MDRTLFFDGMDVLEEDLDNVETTKVAAILRRGYDFATQVGIITGLEVTNPAAFTLEVAPGVAYDANGEAIVVTSAAQIVVNAGDIGSFLVIRHTETDGTPVNHPITGVLNDTRRTDGFELAMEVAPGVNDVVLAEMSALDGGGTATLDVDAAPDGPRVFWSARVANAVITDDMIDPGSSIFAHINTLGTGTQTPTNPHALSPADIGVAADTTIFDHQEFDHFTGIEPDSASDVGLISVDDLPAPDELNIVQMVPGDTILVNRLRIDDTTGFTPTTLTFDDGTTNPALYEIQVNALGSVTKDARLTYDNPAPAITGMWIVEISKDFPAGSYQIEWDNVSQFFRMDDPIRPTAFLDGINIKYLDTTPPAGTSFDNSGFYKISLFTDQEQYIIIYVDAPNLPGSVQVEDFTVVDSNRSQEFLFLGFVNWSGSATGFLGYGTTGGSGVALDKRVFGTMAADQLGQAAEDLIYRTMRETRADGVVHGGQIYDDGGLSYAVTGGVGYLNGRRIQWQGITGTAIDDATTHIWVDENGVVQATDWVPNGRTSGEINNWDGEDDRNYTELFSSGITSPLGTGLPGDNSVRPDRVVTPHIGLGRVIASAGNITGTPEDRVILNQVDNFHRHTHEADRILHTEGPTEFVHGGASQQGTSGSVDRFMNGLIEDLNSNGAARIDSGHISRSGFIAVPNDDIYAQLIQIAAGWGGWVVVYPAHLAAGTGVGWFFSGTGGRASTATTGQFIYLPCWRNQKHNVLIDSLARVEDGGASNRIQCRAWDNSGNTSDAGFLITDQNSAGSGIIQSISTGTINYSMSGNWDFLSWQFTAIDGGGATRDVFNAEADWYGEQ